MAVDAVGLTSESRSIANKRVPVNPTSTAINMIEFSR